MKLPNISVPGFREHEKKARLAKVKDYVNLMIHRVSQLVVRSQNGAFLIIGDSVLDRWFSNLPLPRGTTNKLDHSC